MLLVLSVVIITRKVIRQCCYSINYSHNSCQVKCINYRLFHIIIAINIGLSIYSLFGDSYIVVLLLCGDSVLMVLCRIAHVYHCVCGTGNNGIVVVHINDTLL